MEKIVDKIQKLLALAGNNPCEAEAQAALLKAQAMMAKHNISIAEAKAQGAEAYLFAISKVKGHTITNGLANVIGSSFACKVVIHGGKVSFFGRAMNAKAALSAFEFAKQVMTKGGNKASTDAGVKPGTSGASLYFNSYTRGFIQGIKTAMDEQTVALAVVVPEDVKEAFAEKFPKLGTYRGRVDNSIVSDVFAQGKADGRTVMRKRSLESGN